MVLASCGRVHATDRRVIYEDADARYPAGDSSDATFPALPYAWIESARLVTRFRLTTVALGFLVTFLAIVADPMAPLQAIAFALGVIGVVTGFLSRSRALEVRSRSDGGPLARRADPGVCRWDLGDASADVARALLRTVRFGVAHPTAPVPDDAPAATAPAATFDADSGRSPRSVAVVPADRPLRVRDALAWGADALCLDAALSEPERRDLAYQVAWAEVMAASASGRPVWVRVDADDLESSLSACVWPGVAAVVVKVDSADAVRRVETVLAALEAGRGIPGPVGIVGVLESGEALWSLRDIAGASPRMRAVVLGLGDLADEDTPSEEESRPNDGLRRVSTREHLWGRATLGAASAGVPLLGLLGTNVDDLAAPRLEAAAEAAGEAGFSGALTPSPDGVLACNAAFALEPVPEAPDALVAVEAEAEAAAETETETEAEDGEPPSEETPGPLLGDELAPTASRMEEVPAVELGAGGSETTGDRDRE